MVVKEKISGALYADCAPGEENLFDSDALALLTFVAGLVVDRLALRKLAPAPALRPLESAAPPSSEVELELAPEPEEIPAKQPPDSLKLTSPTPAAPPPPPALYGAPPGEEPEAGSPEASASWPGLAEPSRPSVAPEESREPAAAPPRASGDVLGASAAAPAAEAPRGVTPTAPPSARLSSGAPRPSTGARRLAGPLAPADTGDERRDEARRFAKLLVSEIKLYNEKIVQEGRQRGNLYELLKEDIDRSRQMYDERIPEDVRSTSNFFYEELVRVLADGKAESLGI
jgi:hypothetical protein